MEFEFLNQPLRLPRLLVGRRIHGVAQGKHLESPEYFPLIRSFPCTVFPTCFP